MAATKKTKAVFAQTPGGRMWTTPLGVVFASAWRVDAVLTLEGVHGDRFRRVQAATYRLAAEACEASEQTGERWTVGVNAEGSLVIEIMRDEQGRAAALLVRLLESVTA